ncbi:cysteine desulfurase family protein [Lacrimispora indolis]|uniref:cysteine desulfurase family protein n=1 Tax=Lacrimispora indolis TaxID=69825 RepID=UPI00045EB55D|nr:cysteine desulfurase family protein [Lacrimispora indolis]
MIYVDNAATTKLDPEAFQEMVPYLTDLYGNPSSSYRLAVEARKAICKARERIANIIGAKENEIIFTSGGSEADSWVINGYANIPSKKQIITTVIEHHAIINSCEAAKRKAVPVIYLSVDKDGIVDKEELKRELMNETSLVSIAYANNEIGTIQDINLLSEIVHQYGVTFHTDAVQVVGHENVDLNNLEVDLLSASAHKFNGPKGIGFLFKRANIDIEPIIYGGKQENHMRGGTENVASIVGMAAALENNIKKLNDTKAHIMKLESYVRNRLQRQISDILFNGSVDKHMPGNISVTFVSIEAEAIINLLDLRGICVSAGSACNEGLDEISHVLRGIGLSEDLASSTIRISIGKYNTLDEMSKLCDEIENIHHMLS